jgi:transcriptional regulator with XRE-family HTH domain
MGSLNKFLHFRKRSGFTQKEFGKKLGIVQGYLSDIENGRKVPSKTLDILFEFTVRASKGKSQIQKFSGSITEINGDQTEIDGDQGEDAMYREKYLDLLEKHIQLQKEINSLREELTKVSLSKEKTAG